MSEYQPEQPDQDAERVEGLRRPKPRIWIACLASYNNGELHGEWIDAAISEEELVSRAQRVLATSPEPAAEEWAIFDSDGFGDFEVGEYERLEVVAKVARGIAEHGHAFSFWAHLHDADPDMLDQFEDAFLGEFESPEAWARTVLDDLSLDDALDIGGIPQTIRPYLSIDYAGWARDAELSGDVYIEPVSEGHFYVFAVR